MGARSTRRICFGAKLLVTASLAPILLIVTAGLYAQSAAGVAEFEVASVKADNNCGNGRPAKLPTPGRLDLECITLMNLIRTAYVAYANGASLDYTRTPIEGGPDWINSDQFDIVATTDGKVGFEEMAGPMLAKLLEDRFKLKVRRETREVPIYALVATKNGTKLQTVKEEDCIAPGPNSSQKPTDFCGRMTMKRNGPNMVIEAHGMRIADFGAGLLASRLDRPVIDKTSITGRFDFHLEFNPSSGPARLAGQGGADTSSESLSALDVGGPSIFTALQEQLGLRIVSDKGPIQVLVIDRVEKPSQN